MGHIKHHDKPTDKSSQASDSSSSARRDRQPATRVQQPQAQEPIQQKQKSSPQEKPAKEEPMRSPVHQQAELIVQEEKEAKTKMPSYKGLEKFKLLEKMGEYVRPLISPLCYQILIRWLPKAALSQMYTKHSKSNLARRWLVRYPSVPFEASYSQTRLQSKWFASLS